MLNVFEEIFPKESSLFIKSPFLKKTRLRKTKKDFVI